MHNRQARHEWANVCPGGRQQRAATARTATRAPGHSATCNTTSLYAAPNEQGLKHTRAAAVTSLAAAQRIGRRSRSTAGWQRGNQSNQSIESAPATDVTEVAVGQPTTLPPASLEAGPSPSTPAAATSGEPGVAAVGKRDAYAVPPRQLPDRTAREPMPGTGEAAAASRLPPKLLSLAVRLCLPPALPMAPMLLRWSLTARPAGVPLPTAACPRPLTRGELTQVLLPILASTAAGKPRTAA